jgi:double-stranded uracil-DNA glycosylase
VSTLPEALAALHASHEVGARLELRAPPIGVDSLQRALEGGGFALDAEITAAAGDLHASVQRVRTLTDRVRGELRLLICGSNPSLYSADRGIPFARPGNRFWPALRRAGLLDVERDCDAALRASIGFTDLVKRATRSAAEVTRAEYRAGFVRVSALVRDLEPAAVCFVGLDGYRRALDRSAQAGWLHTAFAGRPAYLMPSTSGLNARVGIDALAGHLARAASVAS